MGCKYLSLNTGFHRPISTTETNHPAIAGGMVVSVGYGFKQTKYALHGKSYGCCPTTFRLTDFWLDNCWCTMK